MEKQALPSPQPNDPPNPQRVPATCLKENTPQIMTSCSPYTGASSHRTGSELRIRVPVCLPPSYQASYSRTCRRYKQVTVPIKWGNTRRNRIVLLDRYCKWKGLTTGRTAELSAALAAALRFIVRHVKTMCSSADWTDSCADVCQMHTRCNSPNDAPGSCLLHTQSR